ncbi:MAG: hypothetical protein GWO20_13105, partial [Candidatus Korarchaeota archaeon]|nr:hypothetical protein [Candidatus Korarchaeota archaeon]
MTHNVTDKKLLANSARVVMPEVGNTGLPNVLGLVRDDFYRDLEFPLAANTFKNMTYHPTVASALTVIEDTIRRIEWHVEEPEDADETIIRRTEFIRECMDDMDRTWAEYIQEFLSILVYGFSINEKVWKRRKKKNQKSKFDDGLIGWKKLPARNQASIKRWVWDDEGRDLIGVIQDLSQVKGGSQRYNIDGTLVGIPRSKFLHFRHNAQLDNPEGNSPLKQVFIPWKYLTTIEEYEAVGISRDMNGMPMIKLPPEYMAENASEDKKAVFEYMKKVVRNINANEQAGLVFPKFVDPDTKQDAFDFELVGTQGSKSYDTDAIIRRYEQKILMTFLADVLLMGHQNSGSFSLASEKTSLLSVKVDAVLKQIVEVINTDLIPHTFRINGWDDS